MTASDGFDLCELHRIAQKIDRDTIAVTHQLQRAEERGHDELAMHLGYDLDDLIEQRRAVTTRIYRAEGRIP